jgi:hypothetical protein
MCLLQAVFWFAYLSVEQVDQNKNMKLKQVKPKPEMSCLPDYNVQSVLLGITTNNGLEPYVREY